MLSLTGFFLSKKYRMEKFLFWSRVWMFPVISATFILAMIFSFKWGRLEFPIQFSVSLIGYIWCLLILVVFISRKMNCYCAKIDNNSEDIEKPGKTGLSQLRSDREENIYENDQNFKANLMM